MLAVDFERFRAAAAHFAEFFRELNETFIEREDVLAQFALALLSREHVLMTGPPGTAKSNLASAVLGRIVDESTGQPSLFARHFTENTVQTDLIGPIDFKTLMDTGRTEHFTEDGMLGAVHAFLDEVLDGRDMLLRSTLNLLLERELKQGAKTTRGRIECAFMTSNRYISEILESSRETLLAFIDRVAFINFVPRGFADSTNLALVVRRQVGGLGKSGLAAPLTVQDLDVLQAATDAVYVSDELCDSVVTLVDMLDAELAQAARADPNFYPTRYLSTRTAVRTAKLLRSIAVYRKIFTEPDRPLEARHTDVALLRLNLLLAGLPLDAIAKRISKESDPRERRQLEILRTEREIFDRCLKRLPQKPPPLRPKVDVERLERSVREAEAPKQILGVARELATAASSGGVGADRAAKLLQEAVGALTSRGLRAGITPGIELGQSALEVATSLSELADDLEKVSPAARPTARWVRGRARFVLSESEALAREEAGSFELLARQKRQAAELATHAKSRLERAARIAQLFHHLEAEGTDASPAAEEPDRWSLAIARFGDEQALLWDAVLEQHVGQVLDKIAQDHLGLTLPALLPAITQIAEADAKLTELGAEKGAMSSRVLGPRMRPFVSAAFDAITPQKRRELVKEVVAVRELLEKSQLADVIGPEDLLAWSARVLVRTTAPSAPAAPKSRQGWEATRDAGDADTIVDTLVEIAIGAAEDTLESAALPSVAIDEVYRVLRALPPDLREKAAAADLERIADRVAFLEAWWNTISTRSDTPLRTLEKIMSSGFLHVMRTESAPASLALEAAAIAEIFPEQALHARSLRERLEQLDDASTKHLVGLLENRANESWTKTLKRS